MADPPQYLDSTGGAGEDTSVGPDRGSTTSAPRWVKVFGIIALILSRGVISSNDATPIRLITR